MIKKVLFHTFKYWIFILFFLALESLVSLYLAQVHFEEMCRALKSDFSSDAIYLQKVLTCLLQSNDYIMARNLVKSFGAMHYGKIVEIELVSGNGFQLAYYKRNKKPQTSFEIKKIISYSYNNKAYLRLTFDMRPAYDIYQSEIKTISIIVFLTAVILIVFVVFYVRIKKLKGALFESKANLAKRNAFLETLVNISDRLHKSLDLETVGKNAVDVMKNLTGSPSIAFFVLDKDNKRLKLISHLGFSKDTIAVGSTIPLEGSLSGYTVKEKRICSSENISTDSRLEPTIREALVKERFESVVSVPVIHREEVVGVINLIFRKKQALKEENYAILSSIGKIIGMSMANALYVRRLENEIEQRKKIEKALKESEKKFRKITEFAQDSIVMVNRFQEIVFWNKSSEKIFGFSKDEAIGKKVTSLVVPEEFKDLVIENFNNFILTAQSKIIGNIVEVQPMRKDGSIFPAEMTITPIHIGNDIYMLGIIRDISEKKYLEEQLRQAQKLESIGQLVGGIAHDFNNILTSIMGNAELVQMSIDEHSPIFPDVKEIISGSKTAAELVKKLLAFGRKQIIKPVVLNVNYVLESHQEMLSRIIGEDIKIEMHLSDDLPNIKADPVQIEQIMMNLLTNARDAIYQDKGTHKEKRIYVETQHVFLDDAYASTHIGANPGHHVMIMVADTGIGMSKDIQRRAFDPFFTTKEVGKGTGLGLATVYGIVKQNNGSIFLYSEGGKGTTIKIYWPVFDGEEYSEVLAGEETHILKGRETILFVEDDERIRKMSNNLLTRLGYKVLLAKDGFEAMEIAKRRRSKINILMTDLVMPGMNGKELAEKFLMIQPDTKILYCSGYIENFIVKRGILEEGVNFLPKPYSLIDLAKKIREVLDGDG